MREKTWVYGYEPETNNQSVSGNRLVLLVETMWINQDSTPANNNCVWDLDGIVGAQFVSSNIIENFEYSQIY